MISKRHHHDQYRREGNKRQSSEWDDHKIDQISQEWIDEKWLQIAKEYGFVKYVPIQEYQQKKLPTQARYTSYAEISISSYLLYVFLSSRNELNKDTTTLSPTYASVHQTQYLHMLTMVT